jgi:hypothetical protein
VESVLSSGQNIAWAAGFIMTPTALNLKQRRYVESVLAGLPHLAQAVAAIPPEWQPAAFEVVERLTLEATPFAHNLGLPPDQFSLMSSSALSCCA